jgi:hypothetical protein
MPQFATVARDTLPGFADDFAGVEGGIGAWTDRLRDAQRSVRIGEAQAKEKRQNNVQFLMSIYLGGIAIRVRELAEAAVTLVNKGNPHAAAPVARALFETCCVPIYLREQMVPRLRKGRVGQVHKLVFRIGLGTIGMFGAEHIRPIKVDSLLGSSRAELTALAASLPDEEKKDFAELIDVYYGPLSELTHPNYGAATLSIEVGLPPTFLHPTPFEDWTMHAVVSSAAYILGAGGQAFDAVLQEMSEHPMDLPNSDPLKTDV